MGSHLGRRFSSKRNVPFSLAHPRVHSKGPLQGSTLGQLGIVSPETPETPGKPGNRVRLRLPRTIAGPLHSSALKRRHSRCRSAPVSWHLHSCCQKNNHGEQGDV